jgi:hypothetical protein
VKGSYGASCIGDKVSAPLLARKKGSLIQEKTFSEPKKHITMLTYAILIVGAASSRD